MMHSGTYTVMMIMMMMMMMMMMLLLLLFPLLLLVRRRRRQRRLQYEQQVSSDGTHRSPITTERTTAGPSSAQHALPFTAIERAIVEGVAHILARTKTSTGGLRLCF
eukprot:COSAG02_NODE_10372_length_1956_cov_2.769830_2_plen_107_part_00